MDTYRQYKIAYNTIAKKSGNYAIIRRLSFLHFTIRTLNA